MRVTIYHNPKCGTSRTALAMIREKGIEPTIIEYLVTPPGKEDISNLVARMGIPVRAVIRTKESIYGALGLGNDALSDSALLDAIAAHPILLNRPIVVTDKGARLCRPAEEVLGLLD